MGKPFQVQNAGALSLGMLAGGIVLMVVAILALFKIAFTEMGNWDYWVLIIGGASALIGGIWFISYVRNVRKFRQLMEEPSKANFLKKLEDVEYLAWRLPMKFEDELNVKKKRFGLK